MPDLWSWYNYVDSGTITSAAGQQATMPLSNLKDQRVGRVWRSFLSSFAETGGGGPILGFYDSEPLLGFYDLQELIDDEESWVGGEIRVDFGQARTISVVGVFNSNLQNMTQLVFKLGTTPGSGDVWRQYIDPTVSGYRMAVRTVQSATGVAASATARYLTIGFAGGTNFQAGRIWAGGADWRPSVGHILGSSATTVDYSVRAMAPRTGAFMIDSASRRRSFNANYDSISEDEYLSNIRKLDKDVGISSQLLFVPAQESYPLDAWPILGYLQETEATVFTGFLRAERTLSIVEAG